MRGSKWKVCTQAPPQGMLVSGEGLIPSPPHPHNHTSPVFDCGLQRKDGG
jgi:hypothetical protein